MFKVIFLLLLISCNSSNKNSGNNVENRTSNKNDKLEKNIFKNDFYKANNAINTNDFSQLKEAIESDPNILKSKYVDDYSLKGKTLLMYALEFQSDNLSIDMSKIIKLLLENSDLSAVDENKNSVLHYSVFSEEYVKYILENSNVDINIKSRTGIDPLTAAASKGYPESVEVLLDHKNIRVSSIHEDSEIPNFETLKLSFRKSNIMHDIARGIFYINGKLEQAYYSKNIEKKKEVIEDYKKVFELLSKSDKFNMEEALGGIDIFDRTPLKLFISSADEKIKNGAEEALFWDEIKDTFLPFFEKKL